MESNHQGPASTPVIDARKSQKANAKKTTSIAVVIAVISLLIASGSGLVAVMAYRELEESKNVTTAPVSSGGYYNGNSVEFESTSIAKIVEKVTPAVVSIISTSGGYSNSIYSYLYGDSASQSAGTGMIVTEDGYIVTNKHVIEGAKQIQVVTDDGTTYDDVDVVGEDPLNDVAYLKINDAKGLPTIEH